MIINAVYTNADTVVQKVYELPASGTELKSNTIYVALLTGDYVFTPPATGWAHGIFTATAGTVTFSGKYLGAAPVIAEGIEYEFDVYDGVWAVTEVVS